MNARIRNVLHRCVSTTPALIPVVDAWVAYSADRNPWRLLSILGWVVVGAGWFLRPAVFARTLQESNRRGEYLALITHRQWGAIMVAGVLVVSVGMVARYSGAA